MASEEVGQWDEIKQICVRILAVPLGSWWPKGSPKALCLSVLIKIKRTRVKIASASYVEW